MSNKLPDESAFLQRLARLERTADATIAELNELKEYLYLLQRERGITPAESEGEISHDDRN
jgi:hypothetical protein